jgi:hypothetical protein
MFCADSHTTFQPLEIQGFLLDTKDPSVAQYNENNGLAYARIALCEKPCLVCHDKHKGKPLFSTA